MKQGDLIKITATDGIYWGIFENRYDEFVLCEAIKDCHENETGLSKRPKIPLNKIRFPRGTKMRQWKPRTFDRQICRFGLCVRDGKFADRMTITEETVNELIGRMKGITEACACTRFINNNLKQYLK